MSLSHPTKLNTTDLAYCAMFTAVMAICSWISIPAAVPFTLQTFAVFLAIITLGGKRGTLSVGIYLLLGAIGLPVFSGFSGGIGYLLGATGGYIIGFLCSALIMWIVESLFKKRNWMIILSMIISMLVCYTFGTIWYMFLYSGSSGSKGLWATLSWCVFPYVIPDAIKTGLAYIVGKKIIKSRVLENNNKISW